MLAALVDAQTGASGACIALICSNIPSSVNRKALTMPKLVCIKQFCLQNAVSCLFADTLCTWQADSF